ncbi:MAG: nucleotidyltransferase family protein [Candidatus Dormibacteria bacterium]
MPGALSVLLPSPTQTLFLRACLPTGETGRAAFDAWCARVGDPAMALRNPRHADRRMRPLLLSSTARNGAGIGHDLVVMCRAARLAEELRLPQLIEAGHEALERTRAAGVPVIMLRGPVLAKAAHGDVVLRHCHDIDLLVPPEAIGDAVGALAPWPGQSLRQGRRLTHPSGSLIALHSRLYHEPHYCGPFPELSTGQVAAMPAARPIPALDPADLLVYVCAHEVDVGSTNSLRWAADAWGLIDRTPELDWDRAFATARAGHLVLPLLLLLAWLRRELDAAIPEEFLERLGEAAAGLEAVDRDCILDLARKRSGAVALVRAADRRERPRLCGTLLWPSPGYLQLRRSGQRRRPPALARAARVWGGIAATIRAT